jgi:serine/threonine protein phosphatase PrpC
MIVARVAFAGNQEVLYDFFSDIELEPGLLVVCDTARGPQVGTVLSLCDKSEKANRWIIQRVYYREFQQRLKGLNAQANEEAKRKKKEQEEAELAELLG